MSPTVPNPPPRWNQGYFKELERYPHLLEALSEANPIYVVAKRAHLSEVQTWVLQGWADGRSERDLAYDLRRSKTAIHELIREGLYKILLWLVRWSDRAAT